jgi:hypothetical protein
VTRANDTMRAKLHPEIAEALEKIADEARQDLVTI